MDNDRLLQKKLKTIERLPLRVKLGRGKLFAGENIRWGKLRHLSENFVTFPQLSFPL